MRHLFVTLLSIFFASGVMGQGFISGTITDSESGETLIGANVVVDGTATGTSTDFDGKYQFTLEPGVYTIAVSYIGYQDKKVTEVEIKADETTFLDVALGDAAVEIDLEVVVTAKVIERTENALLMLQRKSDKIQDGISSQEMARYGVGDAAAAMKKVTGATVQDGKYIYVRGLGDRYSTAQLNGVQIPSTDPYRNSAQLDLIPSNLLDNIITAKTFTPDQPGNFTGGNVDIKTKSFPEAFSLRFTTSVSYNTQSSFIDNFLTQIGGDTDWLGYDDGSRARPAILDDPKVREVLNTTAPILAQFEDETAALVDQAVNSFSREFVPSFKSVPVDHGFALSLGNQFNLGSNPLGFLFAINYKNSYRHYDDGVQATWTLEGSSAQSLNPNYDLKDTRSAENPIVGGLVGLSYKIGNGNKLSFNAIYNHNTDIISRIQEGTYQTFDIFAPEIFLSRTLHFKERELINYQLSGEHAVGDTSKVKIEWKAGLSNSSQDEPDLRFFANDFDPERNRYSISQANYDFPNHFFRTLDDEQVEGKIDVTIPILQSGSKANKIKFGGFGFRKTRDFEEFRYAITPNFNSIFQQLNDVGGDVDAYFAESNSGIIGQDVVGNVIGNFVDNDSRIRNNYEGETNIWATYLMGTFQLTQRLKFIGGARLENTDIFVESADENLADSLRIGDIEQLDLLPSVSLVYALTEDMNLRGSYSNTIARPNMRELAPFESFDFIGGAIFLGNPKLQRTRILNADLRWEWFFNPGELIAVSTYYKQFTDPIVKAFNPASNPEFIFRNVDEAVVYGIEFEFRKSLSFLNPSLQNFRFGTNVSLIQSVVDIDATELRIIQEVDPSREDTRQFQGQSPFILNANLGYLDRDSGIDAILAYNFFGDRLAYVGLEGTPDIFEKGRGQLDFSFSKEFSPSFSAKLTINNILDAQYQEASSFRDVDFIYSRYTIGRSIGLSLSYTVR